MNYGTRCNITDNLVTVGLKFRASFSRIKPPALFIATTEII